MEKDNIKSITSLADGELKNESEINAAEELVKKDNDLNFEYRSQLIVKKLISERLKMQPVPEKVKKEVIRKIKPSKNIFSFLTGFFRK